MPALAAGLPRAGAGDEGHVEICTAEKRDEYRRALDQLRAIEGDTGSQYRKARRSYIGLHAGCSIGGRTRKIRIFWSHPPTNCRD